MKLLSLALAGSSLLLGATASFDANINFKSPSRRHSGLGIDVGHVERRSWKRGNVAYKAADLNFTHGVASGDPYADSVILWTRVAPTSESDKGTATMDGPVPLYNHATEKYVKADANPICVQWTLFRMNKKTGACKNKVKGGRAYTTSDIDYTVKIEAGGLKPFTDYCYQFTVCDSDKKSPMGYTKTAPELGNVVPKVNFAVFSCANLPSGYFNAYGNAARKQQHDYVIHLGDYIYEMGAKGERPTEPAHNLFTLHDYRTRHGQYRRDPDLQSLSQGTAWIPTWDDHEFGNNGYRDGFSGLNNTEDSFLNDGRKVSVDSRKANAVRAYFEWMPIRETDLDDGLRVWRSFSMGDLVDILMLDTRNYDRSVPSLGWNDEYIDLIRDDPSRTLMGSRQENWFYKSLSRSKERGAKWRIIGNQIVFSRVFYDDEGNMSGDNWDGYIANRNRTLQHMYDNNIDNNIFLSGDSHQNWVSDLAWLGTKDYDGKTGKGAIGVEFAGTAVTSPGPKADLDSSIKYAVNMIDRNEEMQWQEGYYRGYFLLSVTPDKVSTEFLGIPSVASRNGRELSLANFTVKHGDNHLQRPVAGGKVENGYLRGGEVKSTNVTIDTNSGKWGSATDAEPMYLKYDKVN